MNAEEVELLSDSKYRNYVAAVDKALKNFEYSSEWADLISALGKLNKVLSSHRPQLDVRCTRLQTVEKAVQATITYVYRLNTYSCYSTSCYHMLKLLSLT